MSNPEHDALRGIGFAANTHMQGRTGLLGPRVGITLIHKLHPHDHGPADSLDREP